MKRCYWCFKEYDSEFFVCPYCGQVEDASPVEPIHLPPGTLLSGRYILGQAVGSGGFGIVYRAWDMKLEIIVAVKEFFASRLMTRAEGLNKVIISQKSRAEFSYRKERFLAEARTMAKLGAHRNIPNVFEFFEENDTAYIVMELLNGESLNDYLARQDGKIDNDFFLMIVNEVGNALVSLHEQGLIHRDVAPDNIFICSDKEIRIKLLDLGAALLGDSTDQFIDIIMKPGYSPVEQYVSEQSGKAVSNKNMGPWTDIYALGATLYAMLTGIKPIEATDRKIDDTVVPPRELDESIPENLSNTVMKAMAIDRHMRFKTVSEFLKAVNGEKKVVSLAKERKFRKRRRFTGIMAGCLALAIAAGVVFNTYSTKRAEQLLDDATISIWFSVQDNSTEADAMQSIAQDFMSKFPNVHLELRAIPEDEYLTEIENAASVQQLPALFESTVLGDDLLINAADVTDILNSEQAQNCLFLNQYDHYYSDRKRIPLGIEIPMAYVVTSGATSADYSAAYFSAISDFSSDTPIAADGRYLELLEANFAFSGLDSEDAFLNNEMNTCAVLLSSSMVINEVRETLTNYEKVYVFYNADEINCRFTYEWSIGNCSDPEYRAAERLLSWMLGNVYQSTLMISKCNDGQIPVDKTCFTAKIAQQNYAAVEDIYEKFIFIR